MFGGTWLAQWVQYVTLDLGLVSLSPMLGREFKKKKKKGKGMRINNAIF